MGWYYSKIISPFERFLIILFILLFFYFIFFINFIFFLILFFLIFNFHCLIIINKEKSGDSRTWVQSKWEDYVLKLLIKTIEEVNDDEWNTQLGEEMCNQFNLYAQYPNYKVRSFFFFQFLQENSDTNLNTWTQSISSQCYTKQLELFFKEVERKVLFVIN